MIKYRTKEYMESIKYFGDKEYLTAMIYYYVAPTIKRCKPASIITLKKHQRNLYNLWQKYKDNILNLENLKVYELKRTEESLTIMIYDEYLLKNVLYERNNLKFLEQFGYSKYMTLEDMLVLLKERFTIICPHEMGIFLGFPLKDVKIFMDEPNTKCLLVGYWKVYDDLEGAIEVFNSFDKAREDIMNNILHSNIELNHFYIN